MIPRQAFKTIQSLSSVPPNASIYVSTSTSPYFNLSVEDWLFRKTPPERPLLLLFRNEPCVVIGRNQNPWKEVNFPALRSLGVPFIRRRSGGGTVYHDLGNTNFSIHLPRTSFNRQRTTMLVQQALLSLGIDAEINERNDICVGGFKVSGSAYKIVNTRAYHHGTMLISTELNNLGNLLRNTKTTMVTKGVPSVRSPVHNLRQFKPDITHSEFVDSVIEKFINEYKVNPEIQVIHDEEEIRNIEHVKDGIRELQQWQWQYGQTPEFTHKLSGTFPWGEITVDIRSKHGIILSCHLSSDNIDQRWCDELADSLVAAKYASLEGRGERDDTDHPQQMSDIIEWLKEEM
ncbi:Lipoyltransferase and lipoate-protein ligase [Ramaria rubella]|nr:Lipoyltransferase and lipoate-protein ligase [Ramaria rubella]